MPSYQGIQPFLPPPPSMPRSLCAHLWGLIFDSVGPGIFGTASGKRLREIPSAIGFLRPNTGSPRTSKASLGSTSSFEKLSFLAESYVRAVAPINGRRIQMLREHPCMADAATIERLSCFRRGHALPQALKHTQPV